MTCVLLQQLGLEPNFRLPVLRGPECSFLGTTSDFWIFDDEVLRLAKKLPSCFGVLDSLTLADSEGTNLTVVG